MSPGGGTTVDDGKDKVRVTLERQFGDSRIVSPSKTEKLNPLRLKGGDNQTFLTMRLPLQQLRSHQLKQYGLQKDSADFKPTPPDFDQLEIRKRIRLGRKRPIVDP